MKITLKEIMIIIAVVAVFGIIGILVSMNKEETPGEEPVENQTQNSGAAFNIVTAEDLSAVIDKVYAGANLELPSLMTQVVDTTDSDMVQAITGLTNSEELEYVVVSEPMMTSQAYSFVLVKVKAGADANAIAKEMHENVDARKWICVEAEKVYTTSRDDVICLVMSSEENAKPVYEQFKNIAGSVDQEYERTQAQPELPEDM